MAVMNETLGSNKPTQMIGNYDATTFIVSLWNGELLTMIRQKDDHESDDEPLKTKP